MGIEFIGRVKAALLETGVNPQFEYTAGEDLPANAPVCKGADGGVYLAQALSWDRMPCIGVTVAAAKKDAKVLVIQGGIAKNGAREMDFSPDDTIFISPVLGKFTKVPPE